MIRRIQKMNGVPSRPLAEADPGRRFLGTESHQNVLASKSMDRKVRATGKQVCFVGTHNADHFSGWFLNGKGMGPVVGRS